MLNSKRRMSVFLFLVLTLSLLQLFLSCGKPQPTQPLKNTQVYGEANHLPTREILSYQPDATWLTLVSPSIKPLVQTLFKLDSITKGKILKGVKIDPVLSKVMGEDVNSTSKNIEDCGIEIEKPCGFFYNIQTGKWEIVVKVRDKEKLLGIFPSIKKSYLKTAWHSFITRSYPSYIDNITNVSIYFSEDNKVFISNDSVAIIKSVLPKTNPPSFNYGLENKGILSDNEVAILMTSSDKLLADVQNIESTELKALLTTLNTYCEDFGIVMNPNEEKTEIATIFFAKNGIGEPSLTPQTPNLIPDDNFTALKGFLYMPKGLIEFIETLSRNDKGGFFKKTLGPAIGTLSHRLICDELSFGIYENNGKISDFVVATRSENITTLISLLKVVVEESEPIGGLSTLKLIKNSPLVSKIPIDFVIGYKDQLFIVASSVEMLQHVESKLALTPSQESKDNNCKLGYVKINKEKVSHAIENLKIKDNTLSTIKEILPKLSDICINYKSNWGIIYINLGI